MGNQTSHQQPAETVVTDLELRLAPQNFYLVFGKPSIHFARERVRGPLIYDVEVEYDDDENLVEHAATLDLTCAVPRRQKIELISVPPPSPGVVGASKGLALTFQIAATQPPQRVCVYTGVSVEYRVRDGVRLKTSGGVAEGSVCIFDTTETDGLTTVVTNPLVLLQLLQPVKYEEIADTPAVSTVQRVAYAPLVIEVVIGETEEHSKKSQRFAPADKTAHEATQSKSRKKCIVQYTFLEAPEEGAELAGSSRGCGEAQPAHRFTCKVAKQLLQVGNEVYDLEDVFDDGRGDDVRDAAGDEEDMEGLCVICLTNQKDTTILPCRHMCLCNTCAAHLRLSNNRCPLCRGNIDRVMTL
ncbi:Zinc finger, C3HC4 type (RING finger)/Prokaryotic RING finger family 4, putative [Leishmania lindenbergi]|uniref:Zinc finger, C3HC4 type (RING finger)/Prokaryotic RING finger family 4 n=1 Tax=Leishmania lindenbergi TaxID=651832 RepID=A0AAW3AS88_9TRYP